MFVIFLKHIKAIMSGQVMFLSKPFVIVILLLTTTTTTTILAIKIKQAVDSKLSIICAMFLFKNC